MQQVLRATIQRGAGHNVRACTHQRGNTQVERRLPAGCSNSANAAFKCGYPLLQHRIGWVADARINMTRPLQVKEAGRVVTRLKYK